MRRGGKVEGGIKRQKAKPTPPGPQKSAFPRLLPNNSTRVARTVSKTSGVEGVSHPQREGQRGLV